MTNGITEFDFDREHSFGLLVAAGGFEDRAVAFTSRLRRSRHRIGRALLISYAKSTERQAEGNANAAKQVRIVERLRTLCNSIPIESPLSSTNPIAMSQEVSQQIQSISPELEERSVVVDISGMTHLLGLTIIDECVRCGLKTAVVYTEAQSYFPLKRDRARIVNSWRRGEYDQAAQFMQSAALRAVHVVPRFAGNLSALRPACLIIFVGYEPNRIQGLVDQYAPSRLSLYYGESPHAEMLWRTELSRDLHEAIFSHWFVRQSNASTLLVDEIVETLEQEFRVLHEEYDLAVAPQCSKMQAVASYLFWRRHPEVQLLFTSPVSFNPDRYSRGSRRTYVRYVVDTPGR